MWKTAAKLLLLVIIATMVDVTYLYVAAREGRLPFRVNFWPDLRGL